MYNSAQLGGVIYAINKSKFQIYNAYFFMNAGIDSSVIYGLSNDSLMAL